VAYQKGMNEVAKFMPVSSESDKVETTVALMEMGAKHESYREENENKEANKSPDLHWVGVQFKVKDKPILQDCWGIVSFYNL